MWNGDCMEIHNTKEGVVAALQIHPIADRAKPVAEVQSPGWLDSGQNPRP